MTLRWQPVLQSMALQSMALQSMAVLLKMKVLALALQDTIQSEHVLRASQLKTCRLTFQTDAVVTSGKTLAASQSKNKRSVPRRPLRCLTHQSASVREPKDAGALHSASLDPRRKQRSNVLETAAITTRVKLTLTKRRLL